MSKVVPVRGSMRVVHDREDTIRHVRWWIEHRGGGPYYVYQIGGHWMFTTESFKKTQQKYKLTVRNWEEVT